MRSLVLSSVAFVAFASDSGGASVALQPRKVDAEMQNILASRSVSYVWQPGQITPCAGGGCLELAGGDTSNGALISLWECNGQENQAWTFASDSGMIVYQADPSKCIDAGDMSDGNQLQIWDCNGMDQQSWEFDSDSNSFYLARSAGHASKCMEALDIWPIEGAGIAIQIGDCNGNWSQAWFPPEESRSAVTITLQSNTSLCLDLPAGDTTDGTAVWMWDCNGMDSQKWVFEYDRFGYPRGIRYAGDLRKCLDAGGMDGSTQLQIWSCNGMHQQEWDYDDDTSNVYLTYSLTNARNRTFMLRDDPVEYSLCMDLAGDDEVAGTKVSTSSCNGMKNQKWSIRDALAESKAMRQLLVV